jgi:hypothetical protein
MSNDEHRIMEVVADDAPDKASPEYIEDMLKELRQFVNEHDSNPSQRNFDDWSEDHSDGLHRNYFGSWNNAVEAVGGDPNTLRLPVSEEEALEALDEAAEQRIEYEVDGEEKVSPEGEAPMGQHLLYIDSVDNLLSERSYSRKFKRTYTELVIERGHDTAGAEKSEYDWDKVDETLKQVIKQRVYCRALDQHSPQDEVPSNRYIDNHDDLPASDTVRDRYGPREDWPEEVGLEEERDANDVNVDLTDFEW